MKATSSLNLKQECHVESTLIETISSYEASATETPIASQMFASVMLLRLLTGLVNLPAWYNLLRTTKKKYLEPCVEQRRHFTRFVVSCEGLLGKEADVFLKRLSMKLAEKWHRPYSQTVSFVKTRFAISFVRAKNRCLRGSRIPTGRISHRVDWEDGARLGFYSTLE